MGTSFESLSQLPRPLGPFTLIRLIAQGGMGSVFLALRPVEGEPTDEVCVVKTVRTDLKDDREAIGRFLDEARVVQRLDHPAICHTLDAGVVDKSYYLALEFISGRNLRDIQTRAQKLGRPVPDAVIFHAVAEVLGALDYAHSLTDPDTRKKLGIVHRDVSPHNVMLGFDGYAKLIDFGLADHVLKKELTRPGIMVGKLRYNAPEQVRDRALDGRSDLYSVGVMLYELVIGERFYEGLSEEDIWRVAMKGTHRPRLYDQVPASLRHILDLALAPNPEERFKTANDMRDAVLEAAGSRGVRDARRASARFMGEIFAEERRAEREMILQATGLAEARTRLFEKPASLDELSVSSVGRTKVVSPAQVRGALADLVSGFDPNAETVLPEVDVDELVAQVDAERAARDPNVFADGESDDTLPATRIDGRPSRRSRASAEDAPRRPIVDENLRPSRNATATPETRTSLPRQKLREAPVVTAPVRRRAEPAPTAVGPALLVGGIVVAAIVLLGALAIALPRLFAERPERPRAVTLVEPPPAPPPPPEKPPDAPPPPDEHAGDGAGEGGRDDATPTAPVRDDAALDDPPPGDDVRPPKPRQRRVREKLEKPVEKAEKPVEKARPPVRELRTLKEQVEYLRQYCLERVACARSTTSSAAQIATLSMDETKALMAEIPKCIARCQR